MSTKYIFVTGGVLSGLGKGITAASIGNILKARGFSVFMQKFDQYLNVDAGTLNPGEHGECFVTDDGAETDLDLGHYERFIDVNLTRASSIMSGQIYQSILEKERAGQFLGKTIQVIPHVTNEVKERVVKAADESGADILITEIGGTIGDMEGMHFVEAIRQIKYDVGPENVLYVHVGFLPYLGASEELKSKPLQNSARDLQSMGIKPDVIICRSDHPVSDNLIDKIALFTGVEPKAVIPLETVKSVYEVPLILESFNLDQLIIKKLGLPMKQRKDGEWADMVKRIHAPKKKKVTIALVGKYMGMKDTYLSVTEAVKAAALWNNTDVEIDWVDSEKIETEGTKLLKNADGILVPGGFGNRGIEGKILAAKYAREKKIPYLGLCLGLQIAVIEFARNVAKLKDAHSTEMNPETPHPVIHIMPEQEKLMEGSQYGATMRLGAYPCAIKPGTKTHHTYADKQTLSAAGSKSVVQSRLERDVTLPKADDACELTISERHRHRYEVNNTYREQLEKAGLIFAGTSPNGHLAEIIELSNHPFFMASQFHPEFKSRPNKPHPLFREFIKAALK